MALLIGNTLLTLALLEQFEETEREERLKQQEERRKRSKRKRAAIAKVKMAKLRKTNMEKSAINHITSTSTKHNETKLKEIAFSVPYKNKEILAVLNYQSSDYKDKLWVILTHGAGGDLNTPQLKAVASLLASQNHVCVRFTCKGLNIKYRIRVFAEILFYINEKYNPSKIIIGGRSMGARAAAMLVSEEASNSGILHKITGVICLSYPLHKIRDETELRDGPLINAKKPMFFLSGTEDEMCEKTKFEKVLRNMKVPHKVCWLNGYDHSAKSNRDYNEDEYISAFKEITNWCLQNYKPNI